MSPEAGLWVGRALRMYRRLVAKGLSERNAARWTETHMRVRVALHGPTGMP